jgi:TonB family protein
MKVRRFGAFAAKLLPIAILAMTLPACASEQAAAAPRQPGPDRKTCARPEYPELARTEKRAGTTTISFLIGADGYVKQSRLLRSSGSADLDEAARSALALCRFRPAIKDDKPVEAWTPVQYVWSL